jgi:mRNA interferase HigB
VRIISRRRLNEFAEQHPETEGGLKHWYRTMKGNTYSTFAELRSAFSGVDQVERLFVFNVGGNKARLIAAIHFNTHIVYIRAVLTHSEYDKGNWRE